MREAMKCPECGETERFHIAISAFAVTYPDEVGAIEDIEWDETSYALCGECFTPGTVGTFAATFEAHILDLRAKGETEWAAICAGDVVVMEPIDE
jgi:hypothetical protein